MPKAGVPNSPHAQNHTWALLWVLWGHWWWTFQYYSNIHAFSVPEHRKTWTLILADHVLKYCWSKSQCNAYINWSFPIRFPLNYGLSLLNRCQVNPEGSTVIDWCIHLYLFWNCTCNRSSSNNKILIYFWRFSTHLKFWPFAVIMYNAELISV